MVFVKAQKSANKEITYTDENGVNVIKRNGSRAWRNNNPGNIVKGSFSIKNGAIGDDEKMAVFPDENTGTAALRTLLGGATYINLSIRDAMLRYAPPSENDTETYIAALVKAVGVPETTKMSALTRPQLDAFVGAIRRHEGWIVGETVGNMALAAHVELDPRIEKLIALGTDPVQCEELRHSGRKAMVRVYGRVTAENACAATLSIFLQKAGFPLETIEYGAGNLAKYIENTLKWRRIAIGKQQPGDIAVCYDNDPSPPGSDHVFFIIKCVTDDEMLIVDNQESSAPHKRFISGKGKTPVEYFLTARPEKSAAQAFDLAVPENVKIDTAIIHHDQNSNGLEIKFTDMGVAI